MEQGGFTWGRGWEDRVEEGITLKAFYRENFLTPMCTYIELSGVAL